MIILRTTKPVLSPLSALSEEQQALVRQLHSTRENERNAAEQALNHMGAEALSVLRHLLAERLGKIERADKIRHQLWIAGTILPTLILVVMGKLPVEMSVPGLFGMLLNLFMYVGGSYCVCGFLLDMGRMWVWDDRAYNASFRPTQEAALRVLQQVEAVEAVGPLAESVRWLVNAPGISDESETGVRIALTRLLPHLNRSEYLVLTGREKECLYALLREYSAFLWRPGGDSEPPMGQPRSVFDVPMTITLLQMYGRVGDTRAVSHIKRLIHRSYVKGECAGVHEAALAALSELNEHTEEWNTAATHLRASSAPKIPDGDLLLPAQRDQGSPSEQLLRNAPVDVREENHDAL